MKKDEWKALGGRIKTVEVELHGILMDSQVLKINKKTLQRLIKAMNYITAFKSDAEDVMYMKANISEFTIEERKEKMNIFYGNGHIRGKVYPNEN